MRRALALLAGVSVLGAAACQPSQSASGRPAVSADTLRPNDLLNAPVPSTCGHPTGRLVDGVQPGIAERDGGTSLAWSASDPFRQSALVATGDLNRDGVADAATILACNAGGVAWPDVLVLYAPGPTLLGSVSFDKVNAPGHDPGENDVVQHLAYANGAISAQWTTEQDGDAACCATLDYSGEFHWDGSAITWTNLMPHTELPTADAFVTAIRDADAPAATKVSSDAVAADALGLSTELPQIFEQKLVCKGLADTFGMPDPVSSLVVAGPGPHADDTNRVCYLNLGSNYAVIGLRRKGWNDWTVGWVSAA
jgi:hypothetical protein